MKKAFSVGERNFQATDHYVLVHLFFNMSYAI